MELLTIRNLSVERSGRVLVADLHLTLGEGMRVGLIGANGSGKTTLLRVLSGSERATGGAVRRAPGIELGYLPQQPDWDEGLSVWQAARAGLARLDRLERELREQEEQLARGAGDLEQYGELREAFERAGGYAAEALLRENLSELGVGEEKLALSVGRLSGGERKRVALAAVITGEPAVLLLDEPSNDLDLPAIRWLGARLKRWRGALVMVSHDRELLDLVSTHTAVLQEGRIELTRGGYSRLREQQGVAERARQRRERERRKEAARLEGIARELRGWGNAGAQRRRRRAERELDELGSAEATRGDGNDRALATNVREAAGRLLEARHLSAQAGDRRVIEEVHLAVEAGDRIALLGPNGSGKSTLLRLLAGEAASDDPRVEFRWHGDLKILLLGQHDRGLEGRITPLEQLERLVSRERSRMLLALCGLPPESWERLPAQLSGGERARAGLALLIAAEANLLLLDEPTNDLDLSAIETLQRTLDASDAAFVVATHDLALARLAERVWTLEEGRLVEYRGGVDGYLAGRRRLEPGLEGTPAEGEAQEERDDPAGPPEDELDDELERLELERMGLEERLEDPLRLAERERQRLEIRHRDVLQRLSLLYDSRLPEPAPAFRVREGAISIAADLAEEGLAYRVEARVTLRLLLRDGIGHLTLREEEGTRLLPWARSALLDGAVRLAFYALRPMAVQYHSRAAIGSRFLVEGSGGWWKVDRERFEALEAWGGRSAGPAGRESGRSVGGRGRFRSRGRRRSRKAPEPGRETM